MNKILYLSLVFLFQGVWASAQKMISRQGHVAFFSYTPAENIKAENNQVLAIVDKNNGEIAVSMLMNAFVFEKALMREHFNESYVESDIFPKATFTGNVLKFNPDVRSEQTRIIKGDFTMHGATEPLEIKCKISKSNGEFVFSGDFTVKVADYNIKIPPLLAGNIADNVMVNFSFQFEPYDE